MRPKLETQSQNFADFPVEEVEGAFMEVCTRHPVVAEAFKFLAEKDGVSFQSFAYQTIADGYRKQGKPLPPKIRSYLEEHAPQLLKPDLH